jgi:soluble lytic murein transglycosylase-like protein
MRTVFLSPFLDQKQNPTSLRATSRSNSIISNPSFARILGKLQQGNQRTASLRSQVQSQSNSVVSQRLASVSQDSVRTGRVFAPLPRFFSDTRLLNPASSGLGQSRLQQKKEAATTSEVQEQPAASSQMAIRTYGKAITATSQQLGVEPPLSLAVARAESGVSGANEKEVVLNPRAVSSAGAAGLFQLTAATGKEQLREVSPHQVYNPFNTQQNIRLGISYLKEMTDTFAENTSLHNRLSTVAGANAQEVQRLAVAAYNAGPGRVARAQELARTHGRNPAHYRNIEPYLPRETQQYVKKVERFATEFGGNQASTLTARANRYQSDPITTEIDA